MNVKFYKDQDGYPRVDYSKSSEILGCYLEQDIQRCVLSCDETIQVIGLAQKEKLDSWKGTGNAHTVTITLESVIIFNEFSDEAYPYLRITNDFKNAVISWRNFIEAD